MKARQGRLPVAQALDGRGEVVGDEIRVAFVGAARSLDGLGQALPHLRAHGRRVRPVVGEREIELQDLGGKGLHRQVLAGIDAVSGPDQEAEDERGQKVRRPTTAPIMSRGPPVVNFSWQ